MKILLIGEFSGVHNNLKYGLQSLGHSVILFADPDGYRGFDSDIEIEPYGRKSIIGVLRNVIHVIGKMSKLVNHEVVQFISPFSIPWYMNLFMMSSIILRGNRKSVYYVCGGDPSYFAAKTEFRYFPHNKTPDYNNKGLIRQYKWFIKNINIIVPPVYEYGLPYKRNSKLADPILFPSFPKANASGKPSNGRLVILYGITRSEVKGDRYIIPALEKIKSEYADEVDLVFAERVSFLDYTRMVSEADILVDQCNSYSYGMNAILGLCVGAVVLSGAEPEATAYIQVKDCPIHNIVPDANQIHQVVREIIDNWDEKNVILSLDYVDKYHNPIKIATQFEKLYEQQ